MASQQQAKGIYVVPQPPPPSSSVLACADGKAAVAFNVGGIVIGGASGLAGQILQGPGMTVPLGLVIRVRGNPSNTGTARIALLREDLLSGNCDQVQPNTEIIFPVDNLAKIFVYLGANGDGVTISVRSE